MKVQIHKVISKIASTSMSRKDNKFTKKIQKIHPKSIKHRPKICPQDPLGGLLEAIGSLLGGSWGAVGGIP